MVSSFGRTTLVHISLIKPFQKNLMILGVGWISRSEKPVASYQRKPRGVPDELMSQQ
jgi:hypothetical protein